MSLKSKPTAKKKKQKKKSERQKEKTVYKRILPQSAPNDLVKENTKKKQNRNRAKFLWSAVIYSHMGLEWFRVPH